MDIPAFPTHGQAEGDDPRNQILSGGMTLRDYFAAAALQGLCANERLYIEVVDRVAAHGLPDDAVVETITALATDFADAMIAERSKRYATAFQQENSDGR